MSIAPPGGPAVARPVAQASASPGLGLAAYAAQSSPVKAAAPVATATAVARATIAPVATAAPAAQPATATAVARPSVAPPGGSQSVAKVGLGLSQVAAPATAATKSASLASQVAPPGGSSAIRTQVAPPGASGTQSSGLGLASVKPLASPGAVPGTQSTGLGLASVKPLASPGSASPGTPSAGLGLSSAVKPLASPGAVPGTQSSGLGLASVKPLASPGAASPGTSSTGLGLASVKPLASPGPVPGSQSSPVATARVASASPVRATLSSVASPGTQSAGIGLASVKPLASPGHASTGLQPLGVASAVRPLASPGTQPTAALSQAPAIRSTVAPPGASAVGTVLPTSFQTQGQVATAGQSSIYSQMAPTLSAQAQPQQVTSAVATLPPPVGTVADAVAVQAEPLGPQPPPVQMVPATARVLLVGEPTLYDILGVDKVAPLGEVKQALERSKALSKMFGAEGRLVSAGLKAAAMHFKDDVARNLYDASLQSGPPKRRSAGHGTRSSISKARAPKVAKWTMHVDDSIEQILFQKTGGHWRRICETLPRVVASAREDAKYERVLQCCCSSLAAVTSNVLDAAWGVAHHPGTIDLLQEVLSCFRSKSSVVAQACEALACLCWVSTINQMLGERRQLILELLNALERHREEPSMVAAAVHLLAGLAKQCSKNQERLVKLKVLPMVIEICSPTTMKMDLGICAHTLEFFAYMLDHEGACEAMEEEGLAYVMFCTRIHNTKRPVVAWGMNVLLFALRQPTLKKAVKDQGPDVSGWMDNFDDPLIESLGKAVSELLAAKDY